MIPDRIIEQGTLTTDGARTAVEVRLPWYRALPGSCIAGAKLSVDGVEAPDGVAALEHERPRIQLRRAAHQHRRSGGSRPTPPCCRVSCRSIRMPSTRSRVGLTLYIPYIIISDTETLHIDETNTKTMKAVAA